MNWQKYTPETTKRKRETIEWSIFYGYNATDLTTPRVLLVGDSICNGYQNAVRERLDGRVNVTFWASSKCVTDPDYFKELCYMLSAYPYAMVCFNNGLHSLGTDRPEWIAAYKAVVRCIRETLPGIPLALTLSTPLKDARLTALSSELNGYVKEIADAEGLPMIDLFSLMDVLDREEYWSDTYHFRAPAIGMQADKIAAFVLDTLGLNDAEKTAEHAETATGPSGSVK